MHGKKNTPAVSAFPDMKAGGEPFWRARKPYLGHLQNSEARQVYLLNNDWDYLEKDLKPLHELGNGAWPWRKVNLPHTWNQFDATDHVPGYRREASWYRKSIYVPPFDANAVFRLYFEGVSMSCEVYVNGAKAGSHIGGFVGFTIDVSDHFKPDTSNEILVRADNSINPNLIPSQKSDFIIFGGITRDVWLQALPPVFVDRVHIKTPAVNAKRAETAITVHVENRHQRVEQVLFEIAIQAPEGNIVARQSTQRNVGPGASALAITLPAIRTPRLWSPDQPNLYTLEIKAQSGRYKDEATERFGYRWFEFKEHGPFYLNGKRLLLRGTHRHEDYAGYGMAMPDSLHRRDMQMIKDVGANFVRLAHYPQDPAVYRACDELGLLVWDELPWCRGGMGGEEWQASTRRLLIEQIEQNLNHPSIILWSLGNEMYWLPDFPDGDHPDSLKQFVKELNALAQRLDSGRSTTMRKFYDGADITEVFSPSIWAGWYAGVYKNYGESLADARKKYRRFLHAEYGGDSHLGRHTENPITGEGLVNEGEWSEEPNRLSVKQVSRVGDWSESYIVDLFDWHLMVAEQLDWFAGNAQWAFKDFATPLRPENPIPYINQKGLVDRAGHPKDAYFVFKSRWTSSPKFCYIESHSWTERSGRSGQKRQVCVYSNSDEVSLFLNGENLGRKRRQENAFPACGLNWSVLFQEGLNTLLALGIDGGQETARDSMLLEYSFEKNEAPAQLRLSSKPLANGNLLIEVRAVDAQGRLCLDYNERVYFDHGGTGTLLADYGTPTRSRVIELANGKAAIEFVPEKGARATIEARTHDLQGSYLVIGERLAP
ncbi:MAG: glycoside hydrolase family 2 TIM barrel-domain containing protein [bacterium]